ncbi:MAG TPA: DUF167 domain-containing protein [Gammaproteobacteria bacterium]|nr:DUF167 domain-containing protein [Gammaproteobacteria bacterium]
MTAYLNVKVIPGASRNKIAGWIGDAVKIRVQAPPEKGKANAAVIALLADFLDIPAKQLSICAGHTSQNKVVEVQGLSDAELISRLSALVT